jgi:hypothetical protein
MFAFADVMDLLAHELAGLGARRSARPAVRGEALSGISIWH